jgi:CheY-like chemotaxis protein
MKSILVVDDEPRATRVIKLSLERGGYQVEVASNGEEALEKVLRGSFDAVVTDIMMPRMTGREFCEQLQERIPDRKFFIFVATSSADDEIEEWCRDLPRSEFLEKPLSIRHLMARLRHHLGDDPSIDPGA